MKGCFVKFQRLILFLLNFCTWLISVLSTTDVTKFVFSGTMLTSCPQCSHIRTEMSTLNSKVKAIFNQHQTPTVTSLFHYHKNNGNSCRLAVHYLMHFHTLRPQTTNCGWGIISPAGKDVRSENKKLK